ncbi:MAG: sugar kinase [Armatimonadota bacterium]
MKDDTSRSPEVVTLGEVMVRLSPAYDVPLEGAAALRPDTGGSEFGMAGALARLGAHVAWVSRLPDTPLGRLICNAGRLHGIDMSHVAWAPVSERTGLYFVEYLRERGRITVRYDRQGAAVTGLTADEAPWAIFRSARLVHLSGITPALSESCAELAHRAVAEAEAGGAAVSFDVNYRSLLWSPDEARQALEPLLCRATLLIATRSDLATVFGMAGEPHALARDVQRRFGCQVVAVTLGAEGSVVWDGERLHRWVGVPCEEVDRFVAGDCFAAGLIYGFLHGDLQLGVKRGGAMAALKYTIPGDMFWGDADDADRVAAARCGAHADASGSGEQ